MGPNKDYEINTGKIYGNVYARRFAGISPFKDSGIYLQITQSLEIVLREHKIISILWEKLKEIEKINFQNDTSPKGYFLSYRPHIVGVDNTEPYSFDVVNYNASCIINYKDDNKYSQFSLFFALKINFTSVAEIDALLDYQLKENFNNNLESYLQFLDDTILSHANLIEQGKREKVNRYIKKSNSLKESKSGEIDETLTFKTPVKEYTPKELRGLYNLSDKVFRSMVNEHIDEIGELGKSRIYTIKQVKRIFYFLGDPADRTK